MTLDLAALLLRAVLGGIFCAQGFRKLFSNRDLPFGRNALVAMISDRGFPKPALLGTLTSVAELGCGALVLVGFLTRLAVLPLIVIMVLAITQFKWKEGFFGGWDWPFSVLGNAVALFLLGGGAYSLDAFLGIEI